MTSTDTFTFGFSKATMSEPLPLSEEGLAEALLRVNQSEYDNKEEKVRFLTVALRQEMKALNEI